MNKIEVYATITPLNLEMDIPSRVRAESEAELDLDRLYREAVNYGNNGRKGTSLQKGEKGESIKTTLATSRFPVLAKDLVGFKAKVDALPDAYERADRRGAPGQTSAGGSVVEAERLVSTFKQFAARRLTQALADGVEGYDACVAVINEINTRAVKGICKIEVFVKRVNVSQFEGAGQSKRDNLWYRTDKVRKFYVSAQPSVELIETIIKGSLLSDDVVVYNDDFVFRQVLRKDGGIDGRKNNPYSIQMVRKGFDASSKADDLQVARLLQQMRRPKGDRVTKT
jgi:hypothetical protein